MKLSQSILLWLITLFATACGQPGPLYLPQTIAPAPVKADKKIEPSKDLAPPAKPEPESATPKGTYQ